MIAACICIFVSGIVISAIGHSPLGAIMIIGAVVAFFVCSPFDRIESDERIEQQDRVFMQSNGAPHFYIEEYEDNIFQDRYGQVAFQRKITRSWLVQ